MAAIRFADIGVVRWEYQRQAIWSKVKKQPAGRGRVTAPDEWPFSVSQGPGIGNRGSDATANGKDHVSLAAQLYPGAGRGADGDARTRGGLMNSIQGPIRSDG